MTLLWHFFPSGCVVFESTVKQLPLIGIWVSGVGAGVGITGAGVESTSAGVGALAFVAFAATSDEATVMLSANIMQKKRTAIAASENAQDHKWHTDFEVCCYRARH